MEHALGLLPLAATGVSPGSVDPVEKERSEHAAAGRVVPSQNLAEFALADRVLADDTRLMRAVGLLESCDPALSARTGVWMRQRAALALVALCFTTAAYFAPDLAFLVLNTLAALVFGMVFGIRLMALHALSFPQSRRVEFPARLSDATLPIYTVLVALHREVPVVPQLIAALKALDYPPAKLDIILVLEADDTATLAALLAARLCDHMRLVIVPDGVPRTKPRALCYAMTFARGDYVVVYDAEDIPAPGQLRQALTAFMAGGPKLGCVQASLAISNARQSLLTAQFAIEYTALFDAILPALASHSLPLPLGGTSNHFPRHILEAAGGWDPYNVTEDADLGFRLARLGWQVSVLHSETWEEAPHSWGPWLAQRTRWQKGWLQTYFVHMRTPVRLYRELGFVAWIWFQVVLGGGLLSALIHPVFYGVLAWQVTNGTAWPPLAIGLTAWLWWFGLINLAAAYMATVALAFVTLKRRNRADLFAHALVSPLYWLPVSFAAYRALIEWYRRPFFWAKTPHGTGIRDRLTH